MKKNHIKVEQAIRKAIQACNDDFALQSAKASLYAALNSVNKVASKRTKRQTMAERYAEEAKKNHQKWWDKIVENAKKFTEIQGELEIPSSDDESA